MNFEFSREQELLREQAQGFLSEHCPITSPRRILEGDEPFDRDLWKKIVELGWVATVIPEEFDGLGLSYLELAVIAEEMGRALAPVPFSSSVYLATEALLLAGSREQKQKWLPLLASGDAIGTFALAESAGRPSPRSLNAAVSGTKLNGTKIAVPDGDVADFAIVVVRSDRGDGATLYLVELENASRETMDVIDPSRSHARITFEEADCELIGSDGMGWEWTNRIFDRAAVLFAWEQVGGTDAALQNAREYSLNRYAFGRPIGGFQAIKHKLANMYVKLTLARSNCYYGTWALAGNEPELPLAAATARVSSIQAYYYSSKENIQIHGGMGFTWEFDCQLFYRRAKCLAVNVGSELWWQERLVCAYEQSNKAA